MAGAGAALAVSFIVLALAWRTPRFDAATHGRPAPGLARVVGRRHAPSRWLLRVLGLAFFAYVAWAAVAGPDLLANPTFGVVYVLLWVGIVPLSLLFGPFYRAVSPVRTIHLAASRGSPAATRTTGWSRCRGWVGYWPAALGLLAFVWLELVYPGSTYLSPVRLWFAAYLAIVLVGGAVFGSALARAGRPVRGLLHAGRPPVGVRPDRATARWCCAARWATSTACAAEPGLVGVVAVLFGSTAFDSFKDSTEWLQVHPVGGRELDVARTSSPCWCSAWSSA